MKKKNIKKFLIVILIFLLFILIYFVKNKLNNNSFKSYTNIECKKGVIDSITNNNIIISIKNKSLDDFIDNNSPIKFSFQINKKTEIVKETTQIKNSDKFELELNEFFKKNNNKIKNINNHILFFPSWNVMKRVNFKELKIGQYIFVYYQKETGYAEKVIIKLNNNIKNSLNKNFDDMGNSVYKRIYGKIKNIDDNAIYINVQYPDSINSLGQNKKILINNEIEIFNKIKKSQENINAEQLEFQNKIKEHKKTSVPSLYTTNVVDISYLKNGDYVYVYAIDINGSLVANKIEIMK